MENRISVIVPFYNAENTLERCTESILGQTFTNLELLLVDNGSTDGSAALAEKAAGADSRVRYIREMEKGVSAARNRGMKEASGTYIAFVDADDVIEPRCLRELLSMIEAAGADLAAVGFYSFAAQQELQERRKKTADAADGVYPDAAADTPAGGIRKEEQAGDGGNPVPPYTLYDGRSYITDRILYSDNHVWGKLYRKEFLVREKAAFDKGLTIGEDMLFLLHLTGHTMKAVCSGEELYGYYVNPKGAIERAFTDSYLDQIRCWEMAEEWIRENVPEILAGKGTEDVGDAAEDAGRTKQESRAAGRANAAARLTSIRIVAEMLVASKMVQLSADRRRSYSSDIEKIRRDTALAIRDPEVRAELPGGYNMKTQLFSRSPSAYFLLYGMLKKC